MESIKIAAPRTITAKFVGVYMGRPLLMAATPRPPRNVCYTNWGYAGKVFFPYTPTIENLLR